MTDLTYSDGFLAASRAALSSRVHVDLTPRGGLGLTLPLVVANMTAVARRLARPRWPDVSGTTDTRPLQLKATSVTSRRAAHWPP